MHLATVIWSCFLTIMGLCIFEIVSSLDNAVVNASVLAKIKDPKARKFFVTWGLIIAVGGVRGVLPFVIYFVPNMHLGWHKALIGFMSGDPAVVSSVEQAAPYLLLAGGMFLTLLFAHWLMAEEKIVGLPFEDMLMKAGGAWFFAFSGALLVGVLYFIKTTTVDPLRAMNLMLSAAVGIAIFFIADGFKEHAQAMEEKLTTDDPSAAVISDWSKVLFLEVIDATFSTDGVVGAFAFTLVVPFILLGNGLGAYVVRQLTLGNVDRLSAYDYLKSGAFYSIGALGIAMILEGFSIHIPQWFSPLVTFTFVTVAFYASVRVNKLRKKDLEALAPQV